MSAYLESSSIYTSLWLSCKAFCNYEEVLLSGSQIMASGENHSPMAEKAEKQANNTALDLLMNALKVVKSQARHIPHDLNLIKEVAKAALNNGLTDPKDLLVRVLLDLINSLTMFDCALARGFNSTRNLSPRRQGTRFCRKQAS